MYATVRANSESSLSHVISSVQLEIGTHLALNVHCQVGLAFTIFVNEETTWFRDTKLSTSRGRTIIPIRTSLIKVINSLCGQGLQMRAGLCD